MTWLGQGDLEHRTKELAARLPAELDVFAKLAFNYRWSWMPGGPELFEAIDPYRWAVRRGNPVRLLLEMPVHPLSAAAGDRDLLQRATALHEEMVRDLDRPFSAGSPDRPTVFFCAEYGIHSSLPAYSGGLGVLAGDILKEASDLALPMVGVGMLYREGNFRQRIDRTGWQHEYWVESDPDRLPMALVTGEDGDPLTITVPFRGRDVVAQIWRVDVGRVPLYLLDTRRPENSRVDRWITARVYVGDRKIRLAQYVLLGIGGVRALRAMDIEPGLLHLNEGHAALAPLELTRPRVEAGVPFADALAEARERTIFTTHTPVPAGNETYSPEELAEALGEYHRGLGATERDVLALGQARPDDPSDAFGLTVLGLRVSRQANGVSRRHGDVARSMWRPLFTDRPAGTVPIGHITNGVHLPSWMAPAMRTLLDRHLGEGWAGRAAAPGTWSGVKDIPDEELWNVRSHLRAALVDYVRDKSASDRLARGEPVDYAEAAAEAFDPNIVTLGFARRVAAYKRLYLLVLDPDRARQLLEAPRPFQLVISGKAHQEDEEAKKVLRSVFSMKLEQHVAERVAFLEDYDLFVARRLVWGCDVWLNLPRAPLEASGTSGMKSALNGGLNLSSLDGWWEEAYDGTNGWAIENHEIDGSQPQDGAEPSEAADAADAGRLFELLEKEVTPLFYDQDHGGIPRGWVMRIKDSLRTIGPRFCATRMLQDYARDAYHLT
jgi:glycogen phosphorylase